jgi:hypothetical protein
MCDQTTPLILYCGCQRFNTLSPDLYLFFCIPVGGNLHLELSLASYLLFETESDTSCSTLNLLFVHPPPHAWEHGFSIHFNVHARIWIQSLIPTLHSNNYQIHSMYLESTHLFPSSLPLPNSQDPQDLIIHLDSYNHFLFSFLCSCMVSSPIKLFST